MTSGEVSSTLSTFIRAQIEKRRIAGAALVLVQNDIVLVEQGYGLADIAARRAMTSDTPMRIGSVTKLMTSLAVMQLVDQGRVSLDEDVSRYLDFELAVPRNGAAVTLRRLLCHQAGFADRIGGIGTAEPAGGLGPFLLTRTQPALRQDRGLVAYANYNGAVAARIVERISGRPFEQYLTDHLFAPLGMTRTTAVQPTPSSLQVSSGYVRADVPPTRVSMAADIILEAGSTGVVSSAGDMARLLTTLMDPAPSVVSRAALDQMMTGQAPVPLGFMGLGMYGPLGMGGNPFIGHDGGTGGFQSVVALLPSARLALFAAYNSEGLPDALSPTAELLQFIAARYAPHERFEGRSQVAIAGTYGPTRRTDSSLFRLRQLLQQVSVRVTADGASIGPAIMPIREPLRRVSTGVFTWSGRDVAFATTGSSPLLQIGAPPGLMRLVRWWEHAGLVMLTIAGCMAASFITIAAWPIGIIRGRRERPPRLARWLRVSVRFALALYLVAWALALLLVFVWWPDVALSSPFVLPLTATIYATAWAAVLLTAMATWLAVRLMRDVPVTFALAREAVLLVLLIVLGLYSVYWRVAGFTLAL